MTDAMDDKIDAAKGGESRPDDEERRLRERLKARASGETETSPPPEAQRRPRSRSREPDTRASGETMKTSPPSESQRRPRSRSREPDYRRGGPPSRRRGPPPPRYRDQERYRPYPRGPPPPRGGRYGPPGEKEEDDFGRRRRPSPPPRGRPRSRSGSSHSSSERGRRRARRRSRSRSSHSSSSSCSSSGSSRSSASSSSASVPAAVEGTNSQEVLYSKDQRTVFVQQLIQRTTERDLKKFFKQQEIKVNEVILLRDKRSGRHKGSAYVECRRMDDVPKAVSLSNTVPSFQRFPILVKASEAEKNYLQGATVAVPGGGVPVAPAGPHVGASVLAVPTNVIAKAPPLVGPNGKLLESQKVYVGSLDPSVTQDHLFLLYSQFGFLQKVALQTDSGTGVSKGFCFLSFHDPKDANLAIQTMSGQVLAGRPMKTGWAVNKVASVPGAEISTSDEFPLDASTRTTNAYRVLAQLTVGMGLDQIRQALVTTAEGTAPAAPASRVPTVADARASLAVAAVPLVVPPLGVPENKLIGRGDQPTPCILVHNMYCKDEETEPGWAKEIKEEFVEECAQHGKILDVKVMSEEPGGKIYASFASTDGAQKCASSIAGRWFNKRQLRVEFVLKEDIPV